MPALNSSVGSKSSTGGRNLNLHLPNTRNCFPDEESSGTLLHSSWIQRLRLMPLPNSAVPPHFHAPALVPLPPPPPAPPPSGGADVLDPGHRNTISTAESRTGATFSSLRSAFFRRLLHFCRERPELDDGNDDDDGSRSLVGFGPFRVPTRRGLLLPASASAPTPAKPPRPWVRLSVVETDHLDQDPDRNANGIGGFGLVRKDSVGVLDKPYYLNHWNLRKEEEEEEEEGSRKTGFSSGIVHNWIHGNRSFANPGAGSSSFRQSRVPVVGKSPASQFSLPFLNHQENLRRRNANSFVRSTTRDEGASGELVGETTTRLMDFEHPWPSGNESGCSPLRRLPPFGLDRSVFKPHLYGDPLRGAAGNMNGANHISRATRGGGGHHDMVDHGAFLDPHLIHHNAVPHKSVCPSEPDEAFSYWNMGRYKRAKTTSSAFPDSSGFSAFSMNRNSPQ
ncbi:hypothetical protein CKAN_00084500 [Cinnamomum micranthum f. kanehirae]|uniref:Uncharacterized protein n=1 Tax=Cinnamomum micranthum f. kanehirae TaxID=337451 RepID=A0A3S3MPQ9_9MAGN|nr:hypothetical protein CKAN_00084500 [Cinnamomum micranthum f. kanehirae]